MNAEELWATKYAQRHAEEIAAEDARREQAFLDLPLLVCGEPLRAMTPMDLLMLNGAESPLVCPGELRAEDIALFVWVLHMDNDGRNTFRTRRRKAKLMRRLAGRDYAEAVASCRDYIEEIFQDAPRGTTTEEKRPFGTCFLAPLVVNIALETGWSQHEILTTPLPRLFQYQKAIFARKLGKEFVDTSPSDRITDEFLCELNRTLSAS
jgi:hypothetical protein